MTTLRGVQIRLAIPHGVVPFYQQILNLEKPEEICYEVLGRLTVNGSMLAPGEFLPSLVRSPLMARFDREILRLAIAQCAAWATEEDRFVHLHVNASAQALVHPTYATFVKELLSRYQVDPQYLTIEVVETCTFWKSQTTLRTLKELRRLGVNIAIDDFPCWENPQALLDWLAANKGAVQTIKLDRSLVNAACGYDVKGNRIDEFAADSYLQQLIRYVAFARKMDLAVVAEGVENQEQMVTMQLCGIELLQGYGIGKPQPAHQFRRPKNVFHYLPPAMNEVTSLAKM